VNADIIGLSGLITPSLDEMVTVARMMQEAGMNTPLLIGGATTSKVHTAVKIEPEYQGAVIHVLDASKSVPVASSLMSDRRDAFISQNRTDNLKVREQNLARRARKQFVPLSVARSRPVPIDWSTWQPIKPAHMGVHTLDDYPLEQIAERFDWSPFFRTWELSGKYPDILHDEIVGEEARTLFHDATTMLKQILHDKSLTCKGVYGLFAANAIPGDSTRIYQDEQRTQVLAELHHLRQQTERPTDRPFRSLADFIAPVDSGIADYMGAFVVSCFGAEALAAHYEAQHDDYNAIMAKALADRFAEAFAELLHERVRKEFWGYARDEQLDNEALISEAYQGIRPAPGYPACPEHSEKATLWRLLDAEHATGTRLTDSYAMHPAASVSGWYIAHPESRYFALGKIDRDQLNDYAQRKGWTTQEAERWLSPVLE
jgi:5-methyltetrahydrofolate--homocysteine methyltransferase